MTLIELLIAMSILGVILTAVASLYVKGYASYNKQTKALFASQKFAVRFDALCRELRQCERIYEPPEDLTSRRILEEGFSPVAGQSAPFIFASYDPAQDKKQVVAYSLDKTASSVVRTIYDPGFDPANPATWNALESKSFLASAQDLTFRLVTYRGIGRRIPVLQIDLTSNQGGGNFPLESRVRIRGAH